MASGVVAACAGNDETSPGASDVTVPTPTEPTAPATSTDASTGSSRPAAADEDVLIAFDGLAGLAGRSLVGVFDMVESRASGGFRLDVDADPFEAQQPVLAADPDLVVLPPVSDDVLLVAPGSYELMIWVVDQDTPYGYHPWLPALEDDLRFCETTVEVVDGGGGRLTITGSIPAVPATGLSVDAHPVCETLEDARSS